MAAPVSGKITLKPIALARGYSYVIDGVNADDLTKRVPVPSFVQNEQLSIALHSAIGDTRIAQTIEESLKFIQPSQLFSVGIFADADYRETPQERFNKLITKLSDIDLPNLLPPSQIGQVNNHSPRCGIFIAPNNREQGTLEDHKQKVRMAAPPVRLL